MTGVLAGALGLLIGLVIGTLGGGGGVLAIPALVYALGQDARTATTGSIIIVGIISAVGALTRLRSRTIDWRTGVTFGIVGLPTAWAGSLLNQTVPQPALLLSFAGLTLTIAVLMLVNNHSDTPDRVPTPGPDAAGTRSATIRVVDAPPTRQARAARAVKVTASAAAVGFLTGFLGVGGGFLVVPALTIVLGHTMPVAIATSLLALTFNSASSMLARIGHLDVDWQVIGPFVAVAVAGALAGKLIADRLSGATLNRAFAVLLILVGGFVGVESLLSLGVL